jgi:hypothetical protein
MVLWTYVVQMKRVFLGWFVGHVVPVQEIFYPACAALVISSKYFPPHRTLLYYSLPIAQKLEQVVVQGRLSLNMCLW